MYLACLFNTLGLALTGKFVEFDLALLSRADLELLDALLDRDLDEYERDLDRVRVRERDDLDADLDLDLDLDESDLEFLRTFFLFVFVAGGDRLLFRRGLGFLTKLKHFKNKLTLLV